MVAHVPHVHAAGTYAAATAAATAAVHFHADDIKAVEKAVDRSQGADKTAEGPVAEYAQQPDEEHDDKLPREQDAQHGKLFRVYRVCQEAYGPLKSPGGADIFAEARQRHVVPEPIPQRDGNCKDREKNVLQPAEDAGNAGLSDFRRGDLVQQLLNKAQGTEPAADRAAEYDTVEQDDAEHIPACLMAGGSKRVLDRAQRAGSDRAGAGIAVKARHADRLCPAHIDLPVYETSQMGIVEQSAVQLHKAAGSGAAALPPVHISIIQGQYTPYKYLQLL